MLKAVTVVENCQFPASVGTAADEQDRLRKLRRFRRRERKLLGRHHRGVAGHNHAAEKKAIRACQASSNFRICAGLDANKRLPFGRRKSLAAIFEIGGKGTWNSVPDEPVRVKSEPKRSGGVRPLCDFGIRNRMMQHAIRKLIAPGFEPKPFQYGLEGKGNGVAHAIADAKTAVLVGNVWAARLDIKDFFPSFQAGELTKLFPLLKKVVRLFSVGNHMMMLVPPNTNDGDYILSQAHRGGPQGSALSPLIGSTIIAQLVWNGNLILINYVDDFLILGPSETVVREAAAALIDKVSSLPGGQFSLQLKDVRHAEDRFFFLGHAIHLTTGKIEITPAFPDDFYEPFHAMEMELQHLTFGLDPRPLDAKKRAFRIIGDMCVFARSWTGAFKACDEMDEELSAILVGLEPYRAAIGCTWEEIDAYQSQDARWRRRYS